MKKKRMIVLSWITCGIVAVASFGGCRPSRATAQRSNIEPTGLGIFSKQATEIKLNNNRVFLWPDGVSAQQIARVMEISDRMDQIDSDVAPIRSKIDQLADLLKPLEAEIEAKTLKMGKNKSKLKGYRADLPKKDKALSDLLESEKKELAKEPKNEEELKKIQDNITIAKNEKNALLKLISDLDLEQQALPGQIAELKKDLSENQNYREKIVLEKEKQNKDDEGLRLVGELSQVVKLSTLSEVDLKVPEEGLAEVSMFGWALKEGETPHDYYSNLQRDEAPAIQNIKYYELGGRLEFDVKIFDDTPEKKVKSIYSFNLARAKYELGKDRVIFSGEVVLLSADGNVISKGVAKLVDKR